MICISRLQCVTRSRPSLHNFPVKLTPPYRLHYHHSLKECTDTEIRFFAPQGSALIDFLALLCFSPNGFVSHGISFCLPVHNASVAKWAINYAPKAKCEPVYSCTVRKRSSCYSAYVFQCIANSSKSSATAEGMGRDLPSLLSTRMHREARNSCAGIERKKHEIKGEK